MNKKYFIGAFLLFFCLAVNEQAYSQAADSLKKEKTNFINKQLGTTDKQSESVVLIMDQYKTDAKSLLGNTTLTEEERKTKFNQLIVEKNAKLKKILTEEQLQKIVPASERN